MVIPPPIYNLNEMLDVKVFLLNSIDKLSIFTQRVIEKGMEPWLLSFIFIISDGTIMITMHKRLQTPRQLHSLSVVDIYLQHKNMSQTFWIVKNQLTYTILNISMLI